MSDAPPQDVEPEAPRQRKRLVLKPRDPVAAAKLEQERLQQSKDNPFGNAKPREAIIAERVGKDEQEVLKQEAETEYQVKLRLTPEQHAQKIDAIKEIDAIKQSMEDVFDEAEQDKLKEELASKQQQLDDMVKGFEQILLDQAKAGGLPRPSERRREQPPRDATPAAGRGRGRGPDSFGAAFGGDRRRAYTRADDAAADGGFFDNFQGEPGREGGRGAGGRRQGGFTGGNYQERSDRQGFREGGRGFANYDDRRAGGGGFEKRGAGFEGYSSARNGGGAGSYEAPAPAAGGYEGRGGFSKGYQQRGPRDAEGGDQGRGGGDYGRGGDFGRGRGRGGGRDDSGERRGGNNGGGGRRGAGERFREELAGDYPMGAAESYPMRADDDYRSPYSRAEF